MIIDQSQITDKELKLIADALNKLEEKIIILERIIEAQKG